MGQRTMGQGMPEQKHNPFQNDSGSTGGCERCLMEDVMVGIVAPRRRDRRSALIEVPEGSQPTLARGVSCASVCRHWGDLRLAVEWASPELEFEDVRGFFGEPLRDGEEPAECGGVRRFRGGFVGVDIGEFETPGGGSGRGIDFRPKRGQPESWVLSERCWSEPCASSWAW